MSSLSKRFTPFQIAITVLVLLCIGLQIGLITILLSNRSNAAPLLTRSDELAELVDQGPYIRAATVQAMLALAGNEITELAQYRIQHTVHISQRVPISANIALNEQIAVPVSLVVDTTIPVNVEIPVEEELLVPVKLEVNQTFPVSTTVPFKDEIVVPISDVVHIDERFQVRVLGQDIEVPIRGDIPVVLDVTVPIDTDFPVRADIPVEFPISEDLPVRIDWMIPVDLEIPLNLPVETEVVVPLARTIPINVVVPIVLDVPIDIALGDTALGAYLEGLGEQLRRMSSGVQDE